jgi:hypothetical protein
MTVRPELIMRLGSLREIILRGTLRGRMLAVSVEQAGDRDAVAGIGKATLGSCRRLGDTVHARPRCAFRRACADVRLDNGGEVRS